MSDILRDLQQMNTFLGELTGALAQARDVLPSRSEGTDRSGTVTVVLGPDDLPRSIDVASNWQQRLSAAELGGAVVEAGQAASVARLSVWQEREGQALWDAVPDQLPHPDAPSPAEPAPVDLTLLLGDLSQVEPRPLDVLVEDTLTALDQAGTPASPVQGRGADQNGRLTLVLSPAGLAACDADERWLAAQSSGELNRALAQALSHAHSDLAAAVQRSKGQASGSDALLREALALLMDPRRLADS
ncbi:hypothetical protein ACFZB9_15225 [Kitasatospora sp. NPDC008050]|uniref:hypothetical protein n=1 Tax=Kitasatospora sp. NPDC008050 TaxID=3364021 RepID=UPI0036EED3E3